MEILIPKIDNNLEKNKTYKIDFENGRIGGFIDDIEAIKQAIEKIILTQRYSHLIYSNNYGNEANTLLKDSDLSEDFILTELENFINEALLSDERITEIDDFEAYIDIDVIYISFIAKTIFGDVDYKGVIENV